MGFSLGKLLGFGDSNTTSQANTTNQTSNTTNQQDNSFMLGDSSFGLRGDQNVIDQSAVTTNSTTFTDASYKSSDTTFTDNSNRSSFTSFVDASDRSTTFTDNSVRASSTVFSDYSVRDSNNTSNTNYSSTTTDFGSVRAALDGITQVSSRSISGAGDMLNSSIGSLKSVSADNLAVIKEAFNFARGSAVDSNASMVSAFGFAQNSIDKSAQAFDNAATAPDNKNIKYLAGAVAAIAIAAFMFKGQ
jgi:hypothetical protein